METKSYRIMRRNDARQTTEVWIDKLTLKEARNLLLTIYNDSGICHAPNWGIAVNCRRDYVANDYTEAYNNYGQRCVKSGDYLYYIDIAEDSSDFTPDMLFGALVAYNADLVLVEDIDVAEDICKDMLNSTYEVITRNDERFADLCDKLDLHQNQVHKIFLYTPINHPVDRFAVCFADDWHE